MTVPGRPATIRRHAASRYTGRRSACSTVSFHFVTALVTARPSMSWNVPVRRLAAEVRPARRKTGVPVELATARPVAALVTPGPAVTAATPGLPPTLAKASAASTAACS